MVRANSTILENFTIQNGATNGDGGGINCMYTQPNTILDNLIIQNNSGANWMEVGYLF